LFDPDGVLKRERFGHVVASVEGMAALVRRLVDDIANGNRLTRNGRAPTTRLPLKTMM
jgi:hypothetical protein